MRPLVVIDLTGSNEVSTPAELDEVLQRRIDGANRFMVATADEDYPMLDVMINAVEGSERFDELALMHYFGADGVVSQAVSDVVDPPDEVWFKESSIDAPMAMPGSTAVTPRIARACIEAFAESPDRPDAAEWVEL